MGKATVITVSIQKGGNGKTTTSGILAYMLARDGKKVLTIDMDSQGNLTDLLTQKDIEFFEGQTILEAFETKDVLPYIYSVNDNIDILPADDYLATFPRLLYTGDQWKHLSEKSLALKEILDPILDQYDYVIIDTPPSLGEHMVNSICVSDYVVILAEGSKWAFTAVPRLMETIEFAQSNINESLKIIGILRTMNDSRRADTKAFVELIGERWPDLVFEVIIKRKAATGRLSMEGLYDNKELASAIDQYELFYKELLQRVSKG